MADGFEFKIDEDAMNAIAQAFDQLERKHAIKVVQTHARKALRPMLKEARRRAPKRSGLLRKSLGTRLKTYRHSGTVYIALGVRTGFKALITDRTGRQYWANPVNYAHLVEHGTQPHPVSRGASQRRKKRQLHESGGMHPGTAARPFMRPAFDMHARPAMHSFARGVLTDLEAKARELLRKAA